VPIRAIAETRLVLGPRALTRYNNLRAVIVNGSAAPGASTGAALAAMEEASARTLPGGSAFEWASTAGRQPEAAGRAPLVLAPALVVSYLLLVALYGSWTVPVPVLLSVSFAALGALAALWLLGMSFDV